MRQFLFLLLVSFLATLPVASPVRNASAAGVVPETLLAKESVAYLRYDGLAGHRTSYEKTVFAQILKDEFQPLINEISRLIFNALGPEVLGERLLQGVPPAELIRLQSAIKQLPRFLSQLKDHGFLVGVEVIDLRKGRFQVTIVFPGGPKTNPAAVLAAVRLFGHLMETKVSAVKVGKRTVLTMLNGQSVPINCWIEGPHAVVTIGTEPPQRTIDLIEGKRPNLTSNLLYRRVSGFRRYETWIRGFADVEAITRLVRKVVPPATVIFSQLGLDGLQNVSFQLGFDGKLQRSTLFVGTKGKRKGLLRLIAPPQSFDRKKLPALPPDAVAVYAGSASFPAIYEEGLRTIRLLVGGYNPVATAEFDKRWKQFEQRLGVSLKKDIVGSLGSRYVLYTSPTDGAFLFGTTLAIEVKDAAKLKRSLNTALRTIGGNLGADLTVKKRRYRGTEMNVIDVRVQRTGLPFAPTYAIHKGWLVIGLYPQSVQGFIYRSGGKAATWNDPPLLERAVKESLRPATPGGKKPKLIGVGVTDPQYALKQVLAYTPMLLAFIRMTGGGLNDFDLSVIPNGQAATERLTKTVTVAVDDGNGIRFEGYASFPIPSQLTGLETIMILPLLQYLRFAF